LRYCCSSSSARVPVRAPRSRSATSPGLFHLPLELNLDPKNDVPEYGFTSYFENRVLRKRPYLTKAICIRVIESPIRAEVQEGDRFRFWGRVEELDGRYLRVVTLSDKVTIHNAFLDRRFRP
jgi:hypothetical protein